MSVIITDRGFGPDSLAGLWVSDAASGAALDLAVDADVNAVAPYLRDLTAIRIAFTSFADGRGFTLAARLRRLGFAGRLRASGHILADQYAMARRAGFDEVEIDEDLARRQPEAHWRARSDWQSHDHRRKLGWRAARS